ncbi:MAG: decaprenyl-phosphate phosphoribosyltransferase [Anaerolineaceae bacterium 4572_32.2]|nr:MAG: decaprenyl-phosphate phosphoribosyltransferase [Anaerolineaceae bacterium 4572_32.2]HEY73173.1 decaprenyl-phosphate phosphoribosyltransferase [Thermoflexia bacterium]
MIIGLIKTMRPKQWVKNVFAFAPLIFDVKLFDPRYLARTIVGAGLLCLVSGVVYIINDLVDIEQDRRHPKKQKRPLASGQVNAGAAIVAAIIIPLIALPAGFLLDPGFGAILTGYLLLQIAYSFWLKNVVIVDVMVIAAGFLLRVAAGVPLVDAERFSPWLYVCMTLLALLIGFGKRRHELVLLKENANTHRKSLQEYSLSLLDHIISIVTASTLVAYAFYTFSAPNLPPNYTMMLTIPFVLYGIFRLLYLIHVKEMGGAPEEIALTDRPLQATFLLWGLSVVIVMYVLPLLTE